MFLCQQHINETSNLYECCEIFRANPKTSYSRQVKRSISTDHRIPPTYHHPSNSTKPIQIQIRIISNNHFEKRHIAFDYRKLVARPPLSLLPSSGNCGGWHCDQPANSLASTGKTMTNAFSLPPPPAYTCAKLRILVPRGLVVVREGTW